MTKFDRQTFATSSFLKEGGIGPVSFGHVEVVIPGLGGVVIVSLGPIEVVMIIKMLDMMLATYVRRVFIKDVVDMKARTISLAHRPVIKAILDIYKLYHLLMGQ